MSTDRFDWMNVAPDPENAPEQTLKPSARRVPTVLTNPLVFALLRNGVEIANNPWRAPEFPEYPSYRGD